MNSWRVGCWEKKYYYFWLYCFTGVQEKNHGVRQKNRVEMIQIVNVGVRKNVVLERKTQPIIRFILKMILMESFVIAKSGILKIIKIIVNYIRKLKNQKARNNFLDSFECDSKKSIHSIRNRERLEGLHHF